MEDLPPELLSRIGSFANVHGDVMDTMGQTSRRLRRVLVEDYQRDPDKPFLLPDSPAEFLRQAEKQRYFQEDGLRLTSRNITGNERAEQRLAKLWGRSLLLASSILTAQFEYGDDGLVRLVHQGGADGDGPTLRQLEQERQGYEALTLIHDNFEEALKRMSPNDLGHYGVGIHYDLIMDIIPGQPQARHPIFHWLIRAINQKSHVVAMKTVIGAFRRLDLSMYMATQEDDNAVWYDIDGDVRALFGLTDATNTVIDNFVQSIVQDQDFYHNLDLKQSIRFFTQRYGGQLWLSPVLLNIMVQRASSSREGRIQVENALADAYMFGGITIGDNNETRLIDGIIQWNSENGHPISLVVVDMLRIYQQNLWLQLTNLITDPDVSVVEFQPRLESPQLGGKLRRFIGAYKWRPEAVDLLNQVAKLLNPVQADVYYNNVFEAKKLAALQYFLGDGNQFIPITSVFTYRLLEEVYNNDQDALDMFEAYVNLSPLSFYVYLPTHSMNSDININVAIDIFETAFLAAEEGRPLPPPFLERMASLPLVWYYLLEPGDDLLGLMGDAFWRERRCDFTAKYLPQFRALIDNVAENTLRIPPQLTYMIEEYTKLMTTIINNAHEFTDCE